MARKHMLPARAPTTANIHTDALNNHHHRPQHVFETRAACNNDKLPTMGAAPNWGHPREPTP
eukprot:15478091-Alexandrium_andersonii.AAC.1